VGSVAASAAINFGLVSFGSRRMPRSFFLCILPACKYRPASCPGEFPDSGRACPGPFPAAAIPAGGLFRACAYNLRQVRADLARA
jgi:hypothetical protein